MKTNGTIRGLAEKMYVEEGLTAKAIANALDVTEQTVGRWKKGKNEKDDWDKKRKDFLAAPHNIKKVLTEELSRLAKGDKSELDMKAINEAIKAIHAISEEISVETIFSVFREFDNWMAEQEPELAIKFLDWHKLYLLHKAKE